jgi:hypothetical protein
MEPISHSVSTMSHVPPGETFRMAFQRHQNSRSAHITLQPSLDHGRVVQSLDKTLSPIYRRCQYFVQGIEGEMHTFLPKSQHRSVISRVGSSIADQLDAICRNTRSKEPPAAEGVSFDGLYPRISDFVKLLESEMQNLVPKEQLQTAKYLVGASIVRQLETICPDLRAQEFEATLPTNTHSTMALAPPNILHPWTGAMRDDSSSSLPTSVDRQRVSSSFRVCLVCTS